jgi:hypothetical protein
MGAIKKFMAGHCENCPLCKHARANPGTLFGKVMALHGKICPFWRAWQEEYGQKQGTSSQG